MYTVYKHTCPNGKVYIGITMQEVNKRWLNGRGYRDNTYFDRAILKYGWNNIIHEILFEDLGKEEAEQKEVELIAEYKSNQREFGYNIENGGNSVGKLSEETKEKIRQAHLGRKMSREAVEKTRLSNLGRHPSKEAREKMSKARLGRKHTEETKEKCRQASSGRKHTESTKEKIRQAHLGQKLSVETIEKRTQAVSKPVICIETNQVYRSATEAGRELKLDASAITKVAKGRRKSHYGFHWEYYIENGHAN